MASAIIHMAVANQINKIINKDNNKILIGSIAPDISKHLGETKYYTHFLDDVENDVPNIDKFLNKYKNKLNDDFVLGYFIHLYTDYLWFKYFIPEICDNDLITKLDGTVVKCNGRMALQYIYNDYTNLNSTLLDMYDLPLNIFYENIPKIDQIIEEIPVDKLHLIVDKTGVIIENSKVKKDLVFNVDNIKSFVDTSVDLTMAKLKELEVV
jgi:hypothetical protein